MFAVEKQSAQITSFNPRSEKSGDKPTPAADIKLSMNLDAGSLAMFAPTLRSLLYYKAENAASNLADSAHDAPDLRYPKIAAPLKWALEITGAKVTIHYGVGPGIQIELCDVNEFTLDPQQGGTVIVGCRVQCHPSEQQAGKLSHMISKSFDVTIEPPESESGADLAGDKPPRGGRRQVVDGAPATH